MHYIYIYIYVSKGHTKRGGWRRLLDGDRPAAEEREDLRATQRERERDIMYIYIYICVYTCTEREREIDR